MGEVLAVIVLAAVPAGLLWVVLVVAMRAVRPQDRVDNFQPHEFRMFLPVWGGCAVLLVLMAVLDPALLDPRRAGWAAGRAVVPGLLLWLASLMVLRTFRVDREGLGVFAFLANLGGSFALSLFFGEAGGRAVTDLSLVAVMISLPVWLTAAVIRRLKGSDLSREDQANSSSVSPSKKEFDERSEKRSESPLEKLRRARDRGAINPDPETQEKYRKELNQDSTSANTLSRDLSAGQVNEVRKKDSPRTPEMQSKKKLDKERVVRAVQDLYNRGYRNPGLEPANPSDRKGSANTGDDPPSEEAGQEFDRVVQQVLRAEDALFRLEALGELEEDQATEARSHLRAALQDLPEPFDDPWGNDHPLIRELEEARPDHSAFRYPEPKEHLLLDGEPVGDDHVSHTELIRDIRRHLETIQSKIERFEELG